MLLIALAKQFPPVWGKDFWLKQVQERMKGNGTETLTNVVGRGAEKWG